MSDNKGLNPIMTGAAGVAIGVAGMALTQKENRKKVNKTVRELQDKGQSIYHDITDWNDQMKSQIKKGADRINKEKKKLK